MFELPPFVYKEFTVIGSSPRMLLDIAFKYATIEEQQELTFRSLSGYYDFKTHTVLMGSWSLKRYHDYMDYLIDKYLIL